VAEIRGKHAAREIVGIFAVSAEGQFPAPIGVTLAEIAEIVGSVT
jgi:tRNA (Thr-GGU) A37 N-methylase